MESAPGFWLPLPPRSIIWSSASTADSWLLRTATNVASRKRSTTSVSMRGFNEAKEQAGLAHTRHVVSWMPETFGGKLNKHARSIRAMTTSEAQWSRYLPLILSQPNCQDAITLHGDVGTAPRS